MTTDLLRVALAIGAVRSDLPSFRRANRTLTLAHNGQAFFGPPGLKVCSTPIRFTRPETALWQGDRRAFRVLICAPYRLEGSGLARVDHSFDGPAEPHARSLLGRCGLPALSRIS
jgi:hypothetical protein